MTQVVNNKKNFLSFFIIFLTSFLLGVIFSFTLGDLNNNQLLKDIKQTDIKEIIYKEKDLDLTKFWQVYSIIKNENYEQNISKEKLLDETIKWLVNGLWDKFSEYLSVEDSKRFNESLAWDFEWIWAIVEKNVLGVKIDRIIKWSPAKKYGLRANDIILKSNNIELKDLDLIEGISHIKWPAWTTASLEILRIWEKDLLNIDVVREKITIPSIDGEIFQDTNIGYISINQFWDNTVEEFHKLFSTMKDTQWLIIDLRDNGWWYLQSAVLILSELIENNKTLVVTKHKEFYKNIAYKSINNWDYYDKNIVVLINENSASASEITAWALRDHKRAIIIWKKSYGKWSVQKPFELQDGSMVKVTIAKWFTPNDKNIDHEWINPDIEVGFEKQDYTPEEWQEDSFIPYDRQLETAKEVLLEFNKLWSLQLTIDHFNQ